MSRALAYGLLSLQKVYPVEKMLLQRKLCVGGGSGGSWGRPFALRGRLAREVLARKQFRDAQFRVLAGAVHQFDEIADDLARGQMRVRAHAAELDLEEVHQIVGSQDRKSTRLNSSHITRSRMPSSA